MTARRLPKSALLRKGWEYEHVYRGGRRLHGEGFTLICRENSLGERRLGISIHRKIRGAVKRNRLKRIIRESFRLWPEQYPAAADTVLAVRPGFTCMHPGDIRVAIGSFGCSSRSGNDGMT